MKIIGKVIFTAGYLEGDDDLSRSKGHRSDVLVKIEENYYELNFISLSRLELELKSNITKDINYFTDQGLIILNEIVKENILNCIKDLINKNYFHFIKPIDTEVDPNWDEIIIEN